MQYISITLIVSLVSAYKLYIVSWSDHHRPSSSSFNLNTIFDTFDTHWSILLFHFTLHLSIPKYIHFFPKNIFSAVIGKWSVCLDHIPTNILTPDVKAAVLVSLHSSGHGTQRFVQPLSYLGFIEKRISYSVFSPMRPTS